METTIKKYETRIEERREEKNKLKKVILCGLGTSSEGIILSYEKKKRICSTRKLCVKVISIDIVQHFERTKVLFKKKNSFFSTTNADFIST